jgi:hypothetical protein
MTNIDQALRLIDILKRDGITIDGLTIYNSANKNFGYLYVRTELIFVTNTTLYPDDAYVSYQIYGRYEKHITSEHQAECDKVFEEQKQDIETLKKKILSLYPLAEIVTLLSPYFCYEYTECLITGEIQYLDIPNPILNKELKEDYERVLRGMDIWKKIYQRKKQLYGRISHH